MANRVYRRCDPENSGLQRRLKFRRLERQCSDRMGRKEPASLESAVMAGLRIVGMLNRQLVLLALTTLLRIRRGRVRDKSIEVEFAEWIARDEFCADANRYKADLVVMPVELTGSSEDDFKTFLRRAGCLLLLINRAKPEITGMAVS